MDAWRAGVVRVQISLTPGKKFYLWATRGERQVDGFYFKCYSFGKIRTSSLQRHNVAADLEPDSGLIFILIQIHFSIHALRKESDARKHGQISWHR